MSKRKNRNVIDAYFDLLLDGCNRVCYICNGKIENKKHANKDHVFPKSQGYSFAHNLMPAHSACNSEKGDRYPTIEEIERACLAYEAVGEIFYPSVLPKGVVTRPFEFFLNKLYREAA